MTVMIDPPSGWKYGFPKAWDKDKYPDLNQWLLHNGYSQRLLDEFGDNLHLRVWSVDVEE